MVCSYCSQCLLHEYFHILEECLDFGVLRSSDPPKSLGLTAYNTMHEPVSISITAEKKKEFVHVQHDAAVFPDRSLRGVKIASVTFDPSAASETGHVSGSLHVHVAGQSEPLHIEFKAVVIKGLTILKYPILARSALGRVDEAFSNDRLSFQLALPTR
nr:unnamed protein product [Spirometra erinaceieuropaei]